MSDGDMLVTCRRWGEMEGMMLMMICGRAYREPPTTLTASWWAGYSGREGGGRGEQRAEPGCGLETRGDRDATHPKKVELDTVCPSPKAGKLG